MNPMHVPQTPGVARSQGRRTARSRNAELENTQFVFAKKGSSLLWLEHIRPQALGSPLPLVHLIVGVMIGVIFSFDQVEDIFVCVEELVPALFVLANYLKC